VATLRCPCVIEDRKLMPSLARAPYGASSSTPGHPTLLLAQAPGTTKHQLTAANTTDVGSRQAEASPRVPALRYPRHMKASTIEGGPMSLLVCAGPSSSASVPGTARSQMTRNVTDVGWRQTEAGPSVPVLRSPKCAVANAAEGEEPMSHLVRASSGSSPFVPSAAGRRSATRSPTDLAL
jgi:hypothetical protein